jgi:hypothetical protein
MADFAIPGVAWISPLSIRSDKSSEKHDAEITSLTTKSAESALIVAVFSELAEFNPRSESPMEVMGGNGMEEEKSEDMADKTVPF